MATARRTASTLQHHSRIHHSIYKCPPVTESHSTFPSISDNSPVPKNGRGYSVLAFAEDDISNVRPDRICLSYVPNNKGRGVSSTCLQPKEVKRVSVYQEIQTIKSSKDSGVSTSRRLHGEFGPVPSLLPCASKPKTPTFSLPCIQRSRVQLDVPSIWALNGSTSILPTVKLGGSPTEESGDSLRRLSRRLPPSSPESRIPSERSRLRTKSSSSARLASKLHQVSVAPSSMLDLPRNKLGYSSTTYLPPTEKSNRSLDSSSTNFAQTSLVPENGAGNSGSPQFCVFRNPLRTVTHEKNSNRFQELTSSLSSSRISNLCPSNRRVSMVDTESEDFSSSPPTSGSPFHVNRRFRRGLGGRSCGSPCSERLVSLSATMAHQPQRAFYGESSHSMQSEPSGESLRRLAVRQQDCSGVYSEPRRPAFSPAPERDRTFVSTDFSPGYSPHPLLHSREAKFCGRQLIPELQDPRMASTSFSNKSSIPALGCSGDRPVCHLSIESGPSLCNSGIIGSSGRICRRLFQNMELQAGLDISSSSHDSASSSTSKPIPGGSVSTGCPPLGKSILESRLEVEGRSSSMGSSRSRFTSNRPNDTVTSSTSRQLSIGDLANTGWLGHIKGWSDNDKRILSSAWRPSTRATYQKPWSRWILWAEANLVDPNNPRPNQLALFLSYLFHSEKLGLKSILLHKSVVSTLSNPDNSLSLSSHPIVTKMIKGISASLPPKITRAIWDVSTLIKWVENHPPSISSFFEVSRHLALLLLLTSGRRVHDLTLLQVDAEHLQRTDDFIVFWPKFGSKSDSSSFVQSGWQFNTSSCPLTATWNLSYWLDLFLDLRKLRCGSLNIESLFITSRGKVRPASRAIIAGWITTVLSAAGIPFSAGSFRSAVSSSLARADLPLDVILSRGNWRASDTFLRHYYKPATTPVVPCTSVISSFQAIV